MLTFFITFPECSDPLWRVMALIATFVVVCLLILFTICVTVILEIVKKQAQVIIWENWCSVFARLKTGTMYLLGYLLS